MVWKCWFNETLKLMMFCSVVMYNYWVIDHCRRRGESSTNKLHHNVTATSSIKQPHSFHAVLISGLNSLSFPVKQFCHKYFSSCSSNVFTKLWTAVVMLVSDTFLFKVYPTIVLHNNKHLILSVTLFTMGQREDFKIEYLYLNHL